MNTAGKCLIVFFIVLLVVMIVVIIAHTSSLGASPGRWNATLYGNDTEEDSLDARIAIVPNRRGVGVDRSGRPRPKWDLDTARNP